MKKDVISFVTTVFNEEKHLSAFLDSILSQTVMPDEIIIVDGGSTDSTLKILNNYQKKFEIIKVHVVPGCKISEGRNFGVKKSIGNIIFTADSGTLFERRWVSKLMNGFENADVVFGKYAPKPKSLLEKFLVSRLPNWDKVNENKFLPSNRQCAFRKIVWENVGGWPNFIKRADDNWFHEKAHSLKFRYKFVKDAEVYWKYERNLKSLLKLSFLDSKSEGFAHLFIGRKIYFAEFFLLAVIMFLIATGILVNIKILLYGLILGILGDILLGGLIPYRKTGNIEVFFMGILLTPLIYFAHVFGVLAGIFQRAWRRSE